MLQQLMYSFVSQVKYYFIYGTWKKLCGTCVSENVIGMTFANYIIDRGFFAPDSFSTFIENEKGSILLRGNFLWKEESV